MTLPIVQDSTWKLGVNHWIENSGFNIPYHGFQVLFAANTWFNAPSNSTYLAFTSSIYGGSITPAAMWSSLASSDRLPHAAVFYNPATGVRRIVEIIEMTNTQLLRVRGNFATSEFVVGNPITIQTTALPAGWDIEQGSGMLATMYGAGANATPGLRLVTVTNPTGGIVSSRIQSVLANTYYRLGVYYKLASAIAGSASFELVIDGALSAEITVLMPATGTQWEDHNYKQLIGSCNLSAKVQFRIASGGIIPLTNPLMVDAVNLCHAKGTVSATDGVLDIGRPDSVQWSQSNVEKPRDRMVGDATARRHFRTINNKKRTIQAQFRGLSESVFNALMQVKQWQDRGHSLVLFTPYRELNPWMVGQLKMSGTSRTVSLLSQYDVDFTFVEA